jgi:hypothetical protein
MNTTFKSLGRGVKLGACFLTVLLTQAAFAQQVSTTASGNVETTIIEQALTLDNSQTLSFGSIFPISTAETVTLAINSGNATTAPTITRSNTNLLVIGPTRSGIWDISGVPGALVTVTLPVDGTVSIEDSLGNSMDVDSFTIRSNFSNNLNLTLSNGTTQFALGATLYVGANQPAGGYTGTYPITVNYQ